EGVRALALVGTPAPAWTADGRLFVVGPAGQLQAWPVHGGSAVPVAPDGVTMVEVGPDGNPAYVRAGTLIYHSLTVSGVPPLALVSRAGILQLAPAPAVKPRSTDRVAGLPESARSPAFPPAGAHPAYVGASGLHLVDLGTGTDVVGGPATGLGYWSPDDR